jgi:hypothetical protein
MKRFQLAVAAIACAFATSAMATSTSNYNLTTGTFATPSATITADTQKNSAGTSVGVGANTWSTSSAGYCTTTGATNTGSACGAGGTNYGNSYIWNASPSIPGVTMSAFGTTSQSTSSTFQKGYVGFYSGGGFGITSQSNGEVNSSHVPDSSSPDFQHAIDNVTAYEEMMLSFTKAVTLTGVSIGFEGADTDATIFEFIGAGAPTVTGKTWSQMLCNGTVAGASGGTTNCWKAVTNLLNMADGMNSFSAAGAVASAYWMVGAYVPPSVSGIAGSNDSTMDAFKLTGFAVAQATVPEPTSVALFGIAAAAFAASRRRRKA